MGYIFDAINKKNTNTPKDDAPLDEVLAQEPAAPIDADQASGQDAEHQRPLRLSDVKLTVQSDSGDDAFAQVSVADHDETPADDQPEMDATSEEEFDHAPISIADHVASQTASQQLEQSPIRPTVVPSTGGWWSRLMGRNLRGNKLDDRLVAMTSPASAMSEEYRSIRTSILARHDNERHLVHTISSATPQEGKTITCVNLGVSFAELRNRTTVIVECDLRLPTFAKLLNCDTNRPGLIDYLRGDAQLKDIFQKVEGSPLHIIPAGGRVSDEAVQLLSSPRMSQLIQALRAKYDHVIIDTPPVLQLADAGILGSQSEEVLLVARMRRTPRPLVEQAVNTLTSYNALVSGIIATDNPRSRGRGYRYGYGYGYGYGSQPNTPRRSPQAA